MVERRRLLAKLRQWILGGHKDENCRVIALMHLESEGRSKPVRTWDIIQGETNIDILASEVQDEAEQDAAGIGDEQKYMVAAYFGDASVGTNAYGGRYAFKINAPPSFDDNGEAGITSSESVTTPKAFAAMAGKFSNEMFRLVIPWANETMRMQQRMIERLEAQNVEMMKDRERMVVLQEKLLSQHHKRQLQTRKVIYWENKKDQLANLLFPMLPVVLNGVAGKQLVPTQRTQETVTIEQFMQVMMTNPEKIAVMQQLLKPQQLPAVMMIIQSVQSGQPVEVSVLKGFISSLDEAQVDAFKEALGEDSREFQMLISIIKGVYAEMHKQQDELRSAYADSLKEEDEESLDSVLDEDAVFK